MSRGKQDSQRTLADWRRIVKKQKQSGLSVAEFCRRNEIPVSSFYQGRHRVPKSNPPSPSNLDQESFVEVNLPALPESSVGLEIVWSQPPVIKIHDSCTESLLARTLRLLKEQSC